MVKVQSDEHIFWQFNEPCSPNVTRHPLKRCKCCVSWSWHYFLKDLSVRPGSRSAAFNLRRFQQQAILSSFEGNYISRFHFCLFAAHATSSAQQNPTSAPSQGDQKTGLQRFRNCTVNKDADSRSKQHTVNKTKTTSTVTAPVWKPGCLYPHVPRSLSQLDKMNTSL